MIEKIMQDLTRERDEARAACDEWHRRWIDVCTDLSIANEDNRTLKAEINAILNAVMDFTDQGLGGPIGRQNNAQEVKNVLAIELKTYWDEIEGLRNEVDRLKEKLREAR